MNSTCSRTQLIEQFVLSYLSPGEFDEIMDCLASREEAPKLKTFQYDIKDRNLSIESIIPRPTDFKVSEIAKDPFGNYVIEGSPNFVKGETGEFTLEYQLRRNNIGRNWINSIESFRGKIVISKSSDQSKLKIKVFHSSRETKEVNTALKKWIRNDFQTKQILTTGVENVIEFGDFSHSQRLEFLMKFTGSFPNEDFSFDKVTDFDFRTDDQYIPATEGRLFWMKGNVSRSSLKGSQLQNIFVLREKNVWDFIEVWYMELRFTVKNADFDGSFILHLDFDGYGHSRSPKSKFQFSVGQVTSRKYRGSTESFRRDILRRIDSYVDNFFHDARSSNNSPNAGTGSSLRSTPAAGAIPVK